MKLTQRQGDLKLLFSKRLETCFDTKRVDYMREHLEDLGAIDNQFCYLVKMYPFGLHFREYCNDEFLDWYDDNAISSINHDDCDDFEAVIVDALRNKILKL